MAQVKVSLLVEDSALPRISEIADSCKAAGLTIESVLEAVGVITGAVEESGLDKLRTADGIANLEIQKTVQLAPPDSNVQ